MRRRAAVRAGDVVVPQPHGTCGKVSVFKRSHDTRL